LKILYSIFETSLGWCGLIGKDEGILELVLPISGRTAVYTYIISKYQTVRKADNHFEYLKKDLKNYFLGKNVSFNFPLTLSDFTPFKKKVWEATREIPYGKVRTYGWIAKKMNGLSARAVGQALNKNPVPILIPCHRVIKKNGETGGFSGGINLKKRLLALEGITFDQKEKIEKNGY